MPPRAIIGGRAATGNCCPGFSAGAGTISGFSIARDGSIALLDASGATGSFGAGSHPLDEAVSHDRFLYVNGANTGQINAFRIGADGSLAPLGAAGSLPAGFGGLVAAE